MKQNSIRFGTDGWCAVLGRDFTFANLAKVTRATAAWLQDMAGAAPRVVVGCDSRFMGETFARYAARVLASEGVAVVLARGVTPTPAISWAVGHMGFDAGVVITASHNPPEYNGFKIKAAGGLPVAEDATVQIELLMGLRPERPPASGGAVEVRDIRASYLKHVGRLFDLEAVRKAEVHAVHDVMFGASRGCLTELLGRRTVAEIRGGPNPGFAGIVPEPKEGNLRVLARAVVERRSTVGMANDGDGDRIGVVDERGSAVSSQMLLALFTKYLYQVRGLSGTIVKTVSTTGMLDRMGRAYGLPVRTCPIGFKHMAPFMASGEALIAGEESGGIAFRRHIPDRDGIYAGLLLMELLAARSRKLSELVAELQDEFGPQAYRRRDVRTPKKEAVLLRLKAQGGLQSLAGYPVRRLETLDGFKHILDAGWLLVRPSGTEPLLRLYAEAETEDVVDSLLQDGMKQLGLP